MNTCFRPAFPALILLLAVSCSRERPRNVRPCETYAPVFPAYGHHIEIPCNIAPLNFTLPDSVRRTQVEVASSSAARTFHFRRNVEFPPKFWKRLTASARQGRTDTIRMKISVQGKTGWIRYATQEWIVRPQPVDPYLTYRLLPSIEGAYNEEKDGYNTMELRERNLENFDEKVLISNKKMERNCFNCHVSPKGNAQQMMIHLRRPGEGSLHIDGNQVTKVVPPEAGKALKHLPDSLKMPLNLVYSDWHPDGKWVAFSSNIIGIYGYAAHHAYADILDSACNIVLYNTSTRKLVLDKTLWTTRYEETWPAWSPDGKWLYFCRTPKLPADTTRRYPDWGERIRHIRFDLCRVAFDAESGTFSDTVQIVAAAGNNRSYSMPCLHPDGKGLLACIADFNSVPYHANGNLTWIDLERQHGKDQENPADVLNSEECESWHDWSANGCWTVFGSKRQNGHYEWPYIAYFDGKRFGKPFLLPQRKGNFYENCFRVFNVPTFARETSSLTPQKAAEGKYASAKEASIRENLSEQPRSEEFPGRTHGRM